MRNISEVVKKILKEVPESEESLTHSLMSLESSIAFSAPELIPLRWQTLTEIINRTIPYPPRKDWEVAVISVFIDKSILEVNESFKKT